MADENPTTGGNGAGDQDNAPQASTIAQYIKDLSVESPSAPQVFRWQEQPQLDVKFNINVENVDDEVHEVVLKIEVSARSESGVHFLVDLSYGGLFALRNFPRKPCPPSCWSRRRACCSRSRGRSLPTRPSRRGFPPLLLDPIDFASAYMPQMEAAQAQAAEANGSAAPRRHGRDRARRAVTPRGG